MSQRPLEGLRERLAQYPELTASALYAWLGVSKRTFYLWTQGKLPDSADALLRLQAFVDGRVVPRRVGDRWLFQETTDADVRVRLQRLLQVLSDGIDEARDLSWEASGGPALEEGLTGMYRHGNDTTMLANSIRRRGHDTTPLGDPQPIMVKFDRAVVQSMDAKALELGCTRSELIRTAVDLVMKQEAGQVAKPQK